MSDWSSDVCSSDLVESDVCIIPPNSFALARTVEFFRIPRDVLVVCLGKSTYARCGIIVNVTPLEHEWEGHVTLEFSNTTPLPAKIYAGEGVAQMLFFQSDEVCERSEERRVGKEWVSTCSSRGSPSHTKKKNETASNVDKQNIYL